MKKIIAIFSVLAMFSVAAIAQDPPKNTVKKPVAAKGKGGRLNVKGMTKAKKANVTPARITK